MVLKLCMSNNTQGIPVPTRTRDAQKEGLEPLLLNTKAVCCQLGGIHPRTLARLEFRGLLRPVSGLLRHKLYARKDIEALVENLSSWKP